MKTAKECREVYDESVAEYENTLKQSASEFVEYTTEKIYNAAKTKRSLGQHFPISEQERKTKRFWEPMLKELGYALKWWDEEKDSIYISFV